MQKKVTKESAVNRRNKAAREAHRKEPTALKWQRFDLMDAKSSQRTLLDFELSQESCRTVPTPTELEIAKMDEPNAKSASCTRCAACVFRPAHR